MKILLVGNFGAKNLGDELILLAALQDYPDATVMTADSSWTQSFCETEFETVVFPPTAFRSWFKYLTRPSYRRAVKALAHKFDRIIFVGGGLFAIKLRACILWWMVFKWLKRLNPKAEIWFENQGIDCGLSWAAKKLMVSVMRQADYVSTRDERSFNQTANLDIPKAELKSDRFWEAEFDWIASAEKQLQVLVNALSPLEPGQRRDLYEKFKNKQLVFVAFQQSDLKAVPKDWPGEIIFPSTQSELFELFDMSELIVGERLHSLLMGSKVLGKKNVYLLRNPYSEKVTIFANTLGWQVF